MEMNGEKFAVKRILNARKAEENSVEYLVDWEPTWVFEEDMDAHLLDDYHMDVKVLGPIHSPENLQKSSIIYMDLVVQRRYREKRGELILELMPYEQVKELYPEELFAYIESTFSLQEEMCPTVEGNTNGKTSSTQKMTRNRAKKLSKKENSEDANSFVKTNSRKRKLH